MGGFLPATRAQMSSYAPPQSFRSAVRDMQARIGDQQGGAWRGASATVDRQGHPRAAERTSSREEVWRVLVHAVCCREWLTCACSNCIVRLRVRRDWRQQSGPSTRRPHTRERCPRSSSQLSIAMMSGCVVRPGAVHVSDSWVGVRTDSGGAARPGSVSQSGHDIGAFVGQASSRVCEADWHL